MIFPDKESLVAQYRQYTDDQLIDVLKKRQDYQDLAVEVAAEIALERKLIHSKHDLLGSEFKAEQKSGKRIFPLLTREDQIQKVFKSLIRVLYLVTIFPAIYAVMNIAGGNLINTIIFAVFAVLWGIVTFRLDQREDTRMTILLLILLVTGTSVIAFSAGQLFKPNLIDVIIYLLSIFLVVYIILYLKEIIKRK